MSRAIALCCILSALANGAFGIPLLTMFPGKGAVFVFKFCWLIPWLLVFIVVSQGFVWSRIRIALIYLTRPKAVG